MKTVYLDDNFNIVPKDQATMAKVFPDDGPPYFIDPKDAEEDNGQDL